MRDYIHLDISDILNCNILTNEELGKLIRHLVDARLNGNTDISEESDVMQLAYAFLKDTDDYFGE